MNIAYSWLQDYVDLEGYQPEQISEILTAIGLEVEGMEEVEQVKGGLRGLVTGKVLTCEKHPNADKLSLTTVDVGGDEPLQIVCGAPNVAVGKRVVVATVGTELFPTEGDSFKIKKGKIRGEVSEGMICAEDEIGIGQSHEGIILLEGEPAPGTAASDYFKLQSDIVYDIGLTPNRSDATAHAGVARDLLAYLRVNHDADAQLLQPQSMEITEGDGPVSIDIRNTEACPRYAGLSMEINIKESPEWLQKRLRSIGINPKNIVVDTTNFILHDMGQPLHAFDADQINGGIIVQELAAGSKIVTLDEVERELLADDLVICDAKENALAIAGVFGGSGSGVTEETKRIFIESAYFNPKWVRRTSMRHGLRTDAAKVYEKGSDPNLPVQALQRAAYLLTQYADGKTIGAITDIYPEPIEPLQIWLNFQRVEQLIGVDIGRDEILRILKALEMPIVESEKDRVKVAVPTDKADVLRDVDLIEEILRIYGLDNVPMPESMRFSHQVNQTKSDYALKQQISQLLVGHGFHETMSLSLQEEKVYKDWLPKPDEELVFINNTSNMHLNTMRADMLVSALENVLYNQNRRRMDLKLFEFGKTYERQNGQIVEQATLSLTITGSRSDESWLKATEKSSFYSLKAFAELVLAQAGITSRQERSLEADTRFAYAYQYHRGQQVLMTIGRVDSQLQQKADISQEVFYAECNWTNLLKAAAKRKVSVKEPARFPSVRRDLALVVPKAVRFEEIKALAHKAEKQLLREINLFDVYEHPEHIGEGKKSYAVSFVFAHPEKTLTDKDIDKMMNKLMGSFTHQLGAEIRR